MAAAADAPCGPFAGLLALRLRLLVAAVAMGRKDVWRVGEEEDGGRRGGGRSRSWDEASMEEEGVVAPPGQRKLRCV